MGSNKRKSDKSKGKKKRNTPLRAPVTLMHYPDEVGSSTPLKKNKALGVENPFKSHTQQISDDFQETWTPSALRKSLTSYYRRGLQIKRLFYPEYPMTMDEHYIKLSILEGSHYQRELNECIQKTRSSECVEDIYEHVTNLYGHQEQECSLSPAQIIPLVRKPNSQEIDEEATKHILILGAAGIGKSTLSEYLCYLWSSDDPSLALTLLRNYQWVFHISLRNLTPERYSSDQPCSVMDIIEKECLAAALGKSESFLSNEDKSILENEFFKRMKSREVLVIIDGFDELSPDCPPNILAAIRDLLRCYHVVVTSRPYNLDELRNNYAFNETVLYEITGFNSTAISTYVEDFFRNLPTDKSKDAAQFMAFLKENPHVAGACRIPIHLELLCSAWERQPIPQGYYSTTKIYNLVTNALCRRYLERGGVAVRDKDSRTILKDCRWPLAFLEHLGFESISQGKVFLTIDFTGDYLRKISDDLSDEFITYQKAFGFIRPNNPSGEYDGASLYYFNHLTFRDYFAARFFAACLQDSCQSPAYRVGYFEHRWPETQHMSLLNFLNRHRFDYRYVYVISFMLGLIDTVRDGPSLEKFLHLLLKPGDKAEIGRFSLVVQCLDEINEIEDVVPQILWDYALRWMKLLFKAPFTFLLRLDQNPFMERLKACSLFFQRDAVQLFFCKKIEKIKDSEVQVVLDVLTRLSQPLSLRVCNAILERVSREPDEFTLAYSEIQSVWARQLAKLCSAGFLDLDTFFIIFQEQEQSSTSNARQLALAMQVIFYAKQYPAGYTEALFQEKMLTYLWDNNELVEVRLAAAAILETFSSLAAHLLLAKKNLEHYKQISMKQCFSKGKDGRVAVNAKPISEAIHKASFFSQFELIAQGQKNHLHLFFAPYFSQKFVSLKNKSLGESFRLFFCWLMSMKETNTNIDLSHNEELLDWFGNALENPELEEEKELFLKFIEQLIDPQSLLVFETFNKIKKKLVQRITHRLFVITAPTIKKYIAAFLALNMTKFQGATYVKALNIIINSYYTEAEIQSLLLKRLKTAPRENLAGVSIQWVTSMDFSFSLYDCTSLLKKLEFSDSTEVFPTYLVLACTPVYSLLAFCKKNQNENTLMKVLMTVLILRHVKEGQALYFGKDGLHYFESRSHKVFLLGKEERSCFEAAIDEGMHSIYKKNMILSEEVIEGLSQVVDLSEKKFSSAVLRDDAEFKPPLVTVNQYSYVNSMHTPSVNTDTVNANMMTVTGKTKNTESQAGLSTSQLETTKSQSSNALVIAKNTRVKGDQINTQDSIDTSSAETSVEMLRGIKKIQREDDKRRQAEGVGSTSLVDTEELTVDGNQINTGLRLDAGQNRYGFHKQISATEVITTYAVVDELCVSIDYVGLSSYQAKALQSVLDGPQGYGAALCKKKKTREENNFIVLEDEHEEEYQARQRVYFRSEAAANCLKAAVDAKVAELKETKREVPEPEYLKISCI